MLILSVTPCTVGLSVIQRFSDLQMGFCLESVLVIFSCDSDELQDTVGPQCAFKIFDYAAALDSGTHGRSGLTQMEIGSFCLDVFFPCLHFFVLCVCVSALCWWCWLCHTAHQPAAGVSQFWKFKNVKSVFIRLIDCKGLVEISML